MRVKDHGTVPFVAPLSNPFNWQENFPENRRFTARSRNDLLARPVLNAAG
eukprot:CAMPEP_0172653490 /NCGR_PEP_ID=MMETSP1068-20121228/243855_1 /TAXON_ID=35684 /ORGANISM="Pseudopedinella elastica, Strain CCMP716" /LENGTH=49 /DNA_ID=CAMNT_0013467925 /DNA_START=1003 /DNA_END=1152 /DNA_ORIENTATION=+